MDKRRGWLLTKLIEEEVDKALELSDRRRTKFKTQFSVGKDYPADAQPDPWHPFINDLSSVKKLLEAATPPDDDDNEPTADEPVPPPAGTDDTGVEGGETSPDMGGGGGGGGMPSVGGSGTMPPGDESGPPGEEGTPEKEEKPESDEKKEDEGKDPIESIVDKAREVAEQTKDASEVAKLIKAEIQSGFSKMTHAAGIVYALRDTNDVVLKAAAQRIALFINSSKDQ